MSRKFLVFAFVALGIAALLVCVSCAKKEEAKDVPKFKSNMTIIYWAELMGQLEPSGWGSHRTGGLARLAKYVMRPEQFIPKNQLKNMVVLEGGNLFVRRPIKEEADIERAKRLAKFLAEVHKTIGYHPVGVGDLDLYLGPRFLKSLGTKYGLSLTCANLYSTIENVPLLEPYRIIKKGKKTVVVVGLLGRETVHLLDRYYTVLPKGYHIQRPKDAFSRILAKMESGKTPPDLYIVLAHMSIDELKDVVPIMPKNLVVFRSSRTHQKDRIGFVEHVPVIETSRYGKYISKVEVQQTNKTDPFTESLNAKAVRVEIGRLLTRIDGYNKKAETASPSQKERLGKVVARLQKRVDNLKAELKNRVWSPNMLRLTLIPVDKSIGEEGTVAVKVEAFKAEEEKARATGEESKKTKVRKPRGERVKTIISGGDESK